MSQKSYLPNNTDTASSYCDLSFVDLDSQQDVWTKTVNNHPFNHQIGLFIPFCSKQDAITFLKNECHYYEVECPLSTLMKPDFFNTFVQSDSHNLMLHSIDTFLDNDDVVVLDLNGTLTLSLTKETYESFGIAGRKQTRADRKYQKHLVEIDMSPRGMKPGGKLHERVKWCFENTLTRPFKMVAALVDQVTGTTLDMHWPANMTVNKKSCQMEVDTLQDAVIPSLVELQQQSSPAALTSAMWQKDVLDVMEWLGLAHLKAKRLKASDRSDCFVSLYQAPKPHVTGDGVLVRWKGLLGPSFVLSVMATLRKMMRAKTATGWVSLSVWGFRDTPCPWRGVPHYYYLNGENDYTFLLLPQNEAAEPAMAIGCQMYGSHHYGTQ